jgi:hypothetical protein
MPGDSDLNRRAFDPDAYDDGGSTQERTGVSAALAERKYLPENDRLTEGISASSRQPFGLASGQLTAHCKGPSWPSIREAKCI